MNCHSTRSVSRSWAAFKGVPLNDICAAVTWASPCTFACICRVIYVAIPHPVIAMVLSAPSIFDWDSVSADSSQLCLYEVMQVWNTAPGSQKPLSRMRITNVTEVLWIPDDCQSWLSLWILTRRFIKNRMLGDWMEGRVADVSQVTFTGGPLLAYRSWPLSMHARWDSQVWNTAL